MLQILFHLIGDYIIQNSIISSKKKEKSPMGYLYCTFHCFSYAILFLFITNWVGAVAIFTMHFIIDKWNIVGYFMALKNNVWYQRIDQTGTRATKRLNLNNYGSPVNLNSQIAFWLYVINDNVVHVVMNYSIIRLVSLYI